MEAMSVEGTSGLVRFAVSIPPPPAKLFGVNNQVLSVDQWKCNLLKLQQDVGLPNCLVDISLNVSLAICVPYETYGARRSPALILSPDIDGAKLSEFGGIKQWNC